MGIRVAMIGAGGVGKTEILRRLSGEAFRPTYHPTSGTMTWTIEIEDNLFIVTEYAGQEQLRNVPQEELDAITAYIAVTSESSADMRAVLALQKKMPENIPSCLVVNKIDVRPTTHDLSCCAKRNQNLTAPFMRIAEYYNEEYYNN